METTPESARLGQVQAWLRSQPAGRHLSDDEWMTLAGGEQTRETASVALRHLACCDECRTILRAIRQLAAEAPEHAAPRAAARAPWSVAAGLAAALVAAFGGWLWLAPSPEPALTVAGRPPDAAPAVPIPQPSTAPPPRADPAPEVSRPSNSPAAPARAATPEWLRVQPPAIALYSAGLLTMRGEDTSAFADEFGDAIAPWQAGSHAEAALRLDALVRRHPDVAEGHFYAGTAWLLAGVPADAVAPLRRAADLAPAALQGDALWYLGLALLQLQRHDEAARTFTSGCTAGDTRACRATAHVPGVSPTSRD